MSERLQDFRQLKVWQDSHQLVLKVYGLTNHFPSDEKYGLVSQMRRAAVSIAANIVEGFRRRSKKEKRQFYSIAQSSADELLYFFILCKDLGYIEDNRGETELIDAIIRMLSAMIKRTEQ
jgi:four helix bundle protein